MSSEEVLANARVVISIRAARAAIGMNQQEFADQMGVAKSSIARIETLEMTPKVDFLIKAIAFFKSAGVDVDLFSPGAISLSINEAAIKNAVDMLQDDSQRRSDRRRVLANSRTERNRRAHEKD